MPNDDQTSFIPHPLHRVVITVQPEDGATIFYCGRCGRPFWGDPLRIVSITPHVGGQLPFCKECAQWAVALRAEHGLQIVPVSDEAYKGGYVKAEDLPDQI